MDTNLKGVWLCMKYEIPEMLKQGGGVIVNNSSISGVSFLHGPPVYRASKHGVIALSKSAATDYRKQGIRVNVVCPGDIHTPSWEQAIQRKLVSKERVEAIESEGFFGEPADIAEAVVWLCSDATSFITGHALVIDGGRIISRF
jgi:NAD(P)-dependent dehydrogenase (short-subunit alcohol dehydrogenase family)